MKRYSPLQPSAFAVITGASTGLGAAFARQLAASGKPLLLVSLPGEGLPELAGELQRTCHITVLPVEADLTRDEDRERLVGLCVEREIDLLINNAGIGGSRPIEEASAAWLEQIIRLNVLATALLTHALIPVLKKQAEAAILNVSSMAAFTPMPYKMVYPATKAFVTSFSMGLDAELREKTGVRVFCLHPGGMKTNADVSARLSRQSWLGRKTVLEPARIVDITCKAMEQKNPVIVPGWANKLNYMLFRYLPWSFRSNALLRFMKRELGL